MLLRHEIVPEIFLNDQFVRRNLPEETIVSKLIKVLFVLLFHEVVKLDGEQHDDVNSVLAQNGCDTIADAAELSEKVADRVIIEGERLLLKNVLEGYFIVKGGLLFLLICHFVALYSIKHWVKDEDVLLVIFK